MFLAATWSLRASLLQASLTSFDAKYIAIFVLQRIISCPYSDKLQSRDTPSFNVSLVSFAPSPCGSSADARRDIQPMKSHPATSSRLEKLSTTTVCANFTSAAVSLTLSPCKKSSLFVPISINARDSQPQQVFSPAIDLHRTVRHFTA